MKLLIWILFFAVLHYNANAQTIEDSAQKIKEDKKIEQEKAKENSIPEKTTQSTQNKALPQEEIKKLAKHHDSIPLVWKLLEENPNLEFAKVAVDFILELDPIEPQVIQAFLTLASHPDSEIKKYFIEQIKQASENVFTSLRHVLKTGNTEEKEKVAELLSKHGQREIETFLDLLQSVNPTDQAIAKKQLIKMGYMVIVLSRLVELIELNPHKILQENSLEIFKEIGKNNIPALFISIKDGKGVGREVVIRSMKEIGKDVIAPAIGVIRLNPDPILKDALIQIIYEIGTSTIVEILPFIDASIPEVRELVKNIIKKFDSKAIPVLTDIIQNSKDQKLEALKAVAYIGINASSMLDIIKPFLTKESELQHSAVLAVQSMGEASEKVINELLIAFRSPTGVIRAAAANSLANAGVKALVALPMLKGRLKLKDNQIGDPIEGNAEARAAICNAIGSIGAQAESAIPELISCLKDVDENVVCSAAEAIGKISPKSYRVADKVADALIQVFVMYGYREKKYAAKALAKIGKVVLEKITRTLRHDPDVSAREGAAMALGYMGKEALPALNSLIMSLRVDIDIVKKEVIIAIGEIGYNSIEVIRTLIEASNDDSYMVREEVAKALGKMGKVSVPHILLAFRKSFKEESKITLVQALGYLGKDASEAASTLIRELSSAEADLLKEIIRSLGKLGVQGDTLVPVFIEILKKNYDNEVQKLLVEILVQVGEKSIELILPLLKEDSPKAKKSAIEIIDKMGDVASPYLKRILESTQDESLISEILVLLGKRVDYLDELLKFLKHPSESIRKTLIGVLTNIGISCLPKLVQILQTTENLIEQGTARRIIANMGASSIPYLIEPLKKEISGTKKIILVDTIGDIGEKAQMAIIPLVGFLTSWEGEDRKLVAKTLGKIGVTSIPYLVELLNHKDKNIQQIAIYALGETRSPEAIVYLLKSLKNPQLLSIIVDAIIKMKSMAVPVLIKSLSDSNPYIKFACAAVLAEIADPDALEPLRKQESLEKEPMILYMIQNAIKKCGK